jgi:hypothetical protein
LTEGHSISAGYGTREADEYVVHRGEDHEYPPPVPPGLSTLTAAQRALAHFLRLDDDVLAVAAEASAPHEVTADDPDRLAAWIASLPGAEKDHLLLRVVQDQARIVRMEMLRRFRDTYAATIPDPPRRTMADLADGAARRRADRDRRAAAQRTADQARLEAARALAYQRRLDELARHEESAWSRVDAMIATRKPNEYDTAVALVTDLRALAERDGRRDTFIRRSAALRQAHARKPSLLDRLNRAGV